MRYLTLTTAALLGMTALQALAQAPSPASTDTGARPGHEIGVGDSLPKSDKASNIKWSDTSSAIAPTLPAPAVGDNATTSDYLRAARASLVAGRTGEAQQSLEMAETRVLSRSVPQGQTEVPSNNKLVSEIRDARSALGGGDKTNAIRIIDRALAG
jgi:hypothetical protein